MMLDRRALLATSLGALVIPRAAMAATAADYKNLQAFIDSYVNPKLTDGSVPRSLPGISIAILRGNDPVQYLNAGRVSYDNPAKVTPDTLWRVYSMTKPITGMATMKLIEDGKLTLDTPISTILPYFKDMRVRVSNGSAETRPAVKPILIRHLLTHTSGMGYALPGNSSPTALGYIKAGILPGSRETAKAAGADFAPARTLDELGERVAKMPLDFEPGSRWQYAVGIDILGLIIQKVSGKSFYDYLRTNFFEPLKMRDTDFMVPASKLNRFTSVYAARPGGRLEVVEDRKTSAFARDRDIQSGGGGLVSSARDYARFNAMLLNEGILDGGRVVKAETVRVARSNLMEPNVFFGGRNGYGAAMQVILPGGERPGQEPPGSYGWFGIAGTQMFVDPTNKFSVVTMLQMNPTTYPVQAEYKTAAYKDLATIRA
jgi:CubicO group peptidase (beta-lactamase class C family)